MMVDIVACTLGALTLPVIPLLTLLAVQTNDPVGAVGAAVVILALLVVAGSTLVVGVVEYRRHVAGVPEAVRRERVRAYSAIMREMIAVNRRAVELHEAGEFGLEHRKYAMSKDSAIGDVVADLTETLERNYHILDPAVQRTANEYLDFLAAYYPESQQPPIARLLNLSREVVAAMRDDLDLDSLDPESDELDGETPTDDREDEAATSAEHSDR